jgi:hypothetical protein
MKLRIHDLENKVLKQKKTINLLLKKQQTFQSQEDLCINLDLIKQTQDVIKSNSMNVSIEERNRNLILKKNEQIKNTSPCVMKKSQNDRIPSQNKIKRKSKLKRESRKQRKILYKVDKPSFTHSKTVEININNVNDSLEKIAKPFKKMQTLKSEKHKNFLQIKGMANKFSKELHSNQEKMEIMKKVYLEQKSKIDNTLEKMKFENLKVKNNTSAKRITQNLKKSKRKRISDEIGTKQKDKINLKNNDRYNLKTSHPQNSLIYDHETMYRKPEITSFSSRNRSRKKKLRIQKMDNRRPSKIMKILSTQELQPKINIYHKVTKIYN